MIAENTRDIKIDSNFQSTGRAMTLDAAATEHIISLLTDLYSDPELAVIREYATNALDANVEAGVAAPIEITLPSDLSPLYRVKDNGVGLSEDDLYDIYAKYGRSTKRETNAAVGMLGLGCKSALTYTDQFTLVAVKDGQQCTVSISRGSNGVGELNVVDKSATDAPNGVEVIIPVKYGSSISRKAREFFRYWEPGTVLVNGKQPEPLSGLQVTPDIFVTSDIHEDVVIMGNVPYPALIYTDLGYGMHVVARVPIGAVHFTPSREALHMTTKTEGQITALATAVRDNMVKALHAHIAAQPDRASAMREAVKWNGKLPRNYQITDPQYQGTTLPTTFKLPNNDKFLTCQTYASALNRHVWSTYMYAGSFPTMGFLTGYDRDTFTAGQKKKLLKWAEDNDLNLQGFALLPGAIPVEYIEFIPAEHIAPWADIQAIKIPRAQYSRGASGRIPGSYDVYVDGTWKEGVPADDIDTSEPVFWIRGGRNEAYSMAAHLSTTLDHYTLVPLAERRIEKFCRNFPNAKDPLPTIKAQYDKWIKRVTVDQKLALTIQDSYRVREGLQMLDAARVDDPDLATAIRLSNMDVKNLREAENNYVRLIGKGIDRGDFDSPLRRYPLVPSSSWTYRNMKEEVYIYINASYAARQAKKSKAA